MYTCCKKNEKILFKLMAKRLLNNHNHGVSLDKSRSLFEVFCNTFICSLLTLSKAFYKIKTVIFQTLKSWIKNNTPDTRIYIYMKIEERKVPKNSRREG